MNPILERMLRERDYWRDYALELEDRLKPKRGYRKPLQKSQGRRILKLVSINGKSPPNS